MVGVGEAMKIDTYSWRLQKHHPAYVLAWMGFFGWCLVGPLLFSWHDMGQYILTVQIGFGVLGWATWSRHGGVWWNRQREDGGTSSRVNSFFP